jgi:hypothetical protein
MVTLFAVVLGVVVGVGLGYLALSGVLALAFRRARTMIRRLADRRATLRPEAPERRHEERRAQ